MPKTEEQGQATRTLLGKIFGMTGKRREVINLNGSGVEDPQAQSLLEKMAAGDKGDGEVGRSMGRVGSIHYRRRHVVIYTRQTNVNSRA